MKTFLRLRLVSAIAVLWLFLVVLPYYLYHPPFDGANVAGVANTLGDIFIVALLLALAAALGHRALRAFAFETSLEALVIQAGIGYGLVAVAVFAVSALVVKPIVFWILVLAGLALLSRDLLQLRHLLGSIQLPRASRGERALALFIVLVLGIAFIFALTPPTGWDALGYHLPLPKAMLALGAFPPASPNLPFAYPSQTEMLFLLSMALKGDVAAQMVHWVYLVLTVGLLLAFCARYFTWQIGWRASTLLVAVPSILLLATYAYNDLAFMFYLLAGLYWTCRAIESGRTRDYVLAGVLAGMTLGEKYTAVMVPIALGALVLFQDGIHVPSRRRAGHAAVLGLASLALAVPWFLRDLFLYGNPVYPFVFGGLYWDAFRAEWFSRFGSGLLNQPLAIVVAPWTATVQGIQGGEFDATIGPLLLAFIPFTLLPSPSGRSPVLRRVAFVACVLLGFWLLGVAQSKLLWRTRFLFPAFPLFALLAAEGWNRLARLDVPQFSVQRFAWLVVGLALTFSLVSIALATVSSRPFDVLLGIEARDQFLVRQLGAHYVMAQWVNQNLPTGARILSLWEPRSYYIERAIEPDPILDSFAHWRFLYGDADRIAGAWRAQSFTHVLLFRAGLNEVLHSQYDPIGEADMQVLRELEANHLRLLYDRAPLGLVTEGAGLGLSDWQANPYAIYEIR